jgi:hypothetical protein
MAPTLRTPRDVGWSFLLRSPPSRSRASRRSEPRISTRRFSAITQFANSLTDLSGERARIVLGPRVDMTHMKRLINIVLLALAISGDVSYNLAVENGVKSEFRTAFGYDFDTSTPSPWLSDIKAVFANLRLVANNAPSSVGGGGTPRAGLAVPVVGPASPGISGHADVVGFGRNGRDRSGNRFGAVDGLANGPADDHDDLYAVGVHVLGNRHAHGDDYCQLEAAKGGTLRRRRDVMPPPH